MLKFSSGLAAVILVLALWYPFVARDHSVYIKPALAVLLGLLLIILALYVWHKLTHVKLKEKLTEELYKKYDETHTTRPVPYEIVYSKNIYNAIATRNYWMYRALGVVGLASSLFLAVAIGQETIIPIYVTKMLAFISSLSTGIIFSFNLVEKSNRARKAFRHILNAIMLYQHNQIEMPKLLEYYAEAENYLGDDEFRQTAAGGTSNGGNR